MEEERLLWSAVLTQAVAGLASPTFQQSAYTWIVSGRRGLGSFLYVCAVLDIDAGWFRKRLFETSIEQLRPRIVGNYTRVKPSSVSASAPGEKIPAILEAP